MNSKLRLGFTGSRESLTNQQFWKLQEVVLILEVAGYKEFRHGACVGSDESAHYAAMAYGLEVTAYPSNIVSMTAKLEGKFKSMPPKPPLERNKDIVRDSDMLLAMPNSFKEEQRSGTWATIRAARKKGIPILIIYPDAQVLPDGLRDLLEEKK